MKVLRMVGVLGALVVAGAVQAQSETVDGVRVWVGPSLSARNSSVGQQIFSSGGVTQDISRHQQDTLHLYGDVISIVNRPVGVTLKTQEELIYGVGIQTIFHSKGTAGTGTYFGIGLGAYRSTKRDSSVAGPSVTKNGLGGKVFVGTSIGGPYFLQLQGTVLKGRNDLQLGVGSKF